jgi:hypothetical protein
VSISPFIDPQWEVVCLNCKNCGKTYLEKWKQAPKEEEQEEKEIPMKKKAEGIML